MALWIPYFFLQRHHLPLKKENSSTILFRCTWPISLHCQSTWPDFQPSLLTRGSPLTAGLSEYSLSASGGMKKGCCPQLLYTRKPSVAHLLPRRCSLMADLTFKPVIGLEIHVQPLQRANSSALAHRLYWSRPEHECVSSLSGARQPTSP